MLESKDLFKKKTTHIWIWFICYHILVEKASIISQTINTFLCQSKQTKRDLDSAWGSHWSAPGDWRDWHLKGTPWLPLHRDRVNGDTHMLQGSTRIENNIYPIKSKKNNVSDASLAGLICWKRNAWKRIVSQFLEGLNKNETSITFAKHGSCIQKK